MPAFKLDAEILAERESLLKRAEQAREDYLARVAEAISLSDHAWGKWLEVRNILDEVYGDFDDFRLIVAEDIDQHSDSLQGRRHLDFIEKWGDWMNDLEDRTHEIPDMHCGFEEEDAPPIFESLVDEFRNLPTHSKPSRKGPE